MLDNPERIRFMWWLSRVCPRLYQKTITHIIFFQLKNNQVADVYDLLYNQGLGWCYNWELIAAGRNSLN